jgi:hypothetical protein
MPMTDTHSITSAVSVIGLLFAGRVGAGLWMAARQTTLEVSSPLRCEFCTGLWAYDSFDFIRPGSQRNVLIYMGLKDLIG